MYGHGMPYKSKAQAGLMHAAAARGDIDPKVVREFDVATKGHFKKLPEHASQVAHKRAVKSLKGAVPMREHAKGRKR